MNSLKRYTLIFFSVLLLVACLPLDAFAFDPASMAAMQAVAEFSAAYGMHYGVQTMYDVRNVSGGANSFGALWDDFNTYNYNNNLPTIDLSDVYSEIQSSGGVTSVSEITSNPPEGYNPTFGPSAFMQDWATFYYSPSVAETMDKFWNWLLTGPAEMQRVDNQYFEFQRDAGTYPIIPVYSTVGAFDPIAHSSSIATPYDVDVVRNTWTPIAYYTSGSDIYTYYVIASTASVFVLAYTYGNHYAFRFYSPLSFTAGSCTIKFDGDNYIVSGSVTPSSSSFDSTNNYYYCNGSQFYTTNGDLFIPSYSNFTSSNTAAISSINGTVVNGGIGVHAYTDTGIVDLPDVTSPTYAPQAIAVPIEAVLDSTLFPTLPLPPIPFDTFIDNTFPGVVDNTIDLAMEETAPIQPSPPPFTDVLSPMIPISLPSFNFSFSGIWHYVRDWVSSLGAWLVTMFSVWNNLPYAMVVPVYASIVILIVLGVYKRFFM